MNKKLVLLTTGLLLSVSAMAQKSKINIANRTLEEIGNESNANMKAGLIQKAKTAIDEAIADASTSSNADAWYTRAKVYSNAASLTENNTKDIETGTESLAKALELNPKIATKEDYTMVALQLGVGNYNAGLTKYNSANYSEAYKIFGNVPKLLGEAPNKKMNEIYPSIDTIKSFSYVYKGLSALNSENFEDAKATFEKLLNDPIADKEAIYGQLIQVSEKSGDKASTIKYIDMAVKDFPANANFSAAQINYYIENNMTTQLLEKLEQAVKNNPNDPQYNFNLGLVYTDMAEKLLATDPTKAAEMENKAEQYYKKAIEIAGDNAMYNQQLGVHYFNKGVNLQNQANKPENAKNTAKQNALITGRDNLFKTAETIFTKAVASFESKSMSSLTGAEKESYYTALQALGRIYASQNNEKKQKEVIEKMKAIK